MHGFRAMQLDLDLTAIGCALIVGAFALGSNPSRLINRLFLFLSLLTAAWLGARRSAILGEDVVVSIRATNAIGAFFPAVFSILKYAVLNETNDLRLVLKKTWLWIAFCSLVSFSTFSDWFIPASSTAESPQWGVGYYVYSFLVGASFIYLFVLSVIDLKRSVGVRRLELNLLLLGGLGSAAIVIILMILRRVGSSELWIGWANLQPLVAISFYSVVVYAMTSHRVLEASQVVTIVARKVIVIIVATVAFYCLKSFLENSFSEWSYLFLCVALILWISGLSEKFIDYKTQRTSPSAGVRAAIYEAARTEISADDLNGKFRAALKKWAEAEVVLLLSADKSGDSPPGLSIENQVVQTLRHLKWVTPERLSREKASSQRHSIWRFLEENRLGVVVVAEGPFFIALVGVGVRSSRRPYTYPQVVELMELAAIMESALERAHFAAKVQRTERLATVGLVGASLAHEIRNPLVSIKTFVQLLPTHYADPAFREKFFRLIGDEVARIDELTQQLLDLAAPRTYQAESVGLHGVLRPGLELVEARAAERGVRVEVAFGAEPDTVFTDAAAAKQVLLNLCFNAIQAVESKDGPDRWVRISTRRGADTVELAVSDSGPGIAPEMQRRLFQPFQTTKSRGFGLGLAICRDILANVRATIAVDPAQPGQGATFRVTFPCQAQLS